MSCCCYRSPCIALICVWGACGVCVAAASGGMETDPNFLFKVRAMNDRLMYTERCFIAPEGLPGRNW